MLVINKLSIFKITLIYFNIIIKIDNNMIRMANCENEITIDAKYTFCIRKKGHKGECLWASV